MSDPFLSDPTRKRKRGRDVSQVNQQRLAKPNRLQKRPQNDEEISESDTDEGEHSKTPSDIASENELSSDDEFAGESAADKRRRLAKQYLENLEQADDLDFDAKDLDDDIIARRLQRDVAESKGHVFKFIANTLSPQLEELNGLVTRIGCKNLTSMAVRYPFLYTTSKDMELIKWDISTHKKPQRVKHTKGGNKYIDIKNTPKFNHHCDQITCVAASPDGKYVVTGGKDARLIIWSSENLACLKVLEARATVNSICFRRNSDQLYAACEDLRVRTFSINQFAQLEILYGHQDNITDISALSRETCVSVGSRDKTALFWKIAEESRLTFRGGDSEKKSKKYSSDIPFCAEGSIDVVSMVDESHFVTGSDNGNISLWSLAKKKPLYTQRAAHGLIPALTPDQASAESSADVSSIQVPQPLPYWITSIYAVPFSDIFVSGSYNGEIKIWQVNREGLRSFSLLGSLSARGCVVQISSAEVKEKKKLTIYALVSKEHKLGRWLSKVEGRNALVSFAFNL